MEYLFSELQLLGEGFPSSIGPELNGFVSISTASGPKERTLAGGLWALSRTPKHVLSIARQSFFCLQNRIHAAVGVSVSSLSIINKHLTQSYVSMCGVIGTGSRNEPAVELVGPRFFCHLSEAGHR